MGCSAQAAWSCRLGAAGIALVWPVMASAQVVPPRPSSGETAPARSPAPEPDEPDAFLSRASPWLDFSLTSFYFDERVGNFLNLGAQFGVYAFDRLRLSGRLVVPLERVTDSTSSYDDYRPAGGTYTRAVPSRSVSLLYGASLGLVVTNSKSFVFGPNVGFVRTDVEDYGTAVAFGLPFEWTTRTNLRVGFEMSLGHATGGSRRTICVSGITSCGSSRQERPGGTVVLFQFYMGWALGRL